MELVTGEFLEWKLGAKASAFMSEIAARVPIIDFIVSRCALNPGFASGTVEVLYSYVTYRIKEKTDETGLLFELCQELDIQIVCPECATSVSVWRTVQ